MHKMCAFKGGGGAGTSLAVTFAQPHQKDHYEIGYMERQLPESTLAASAAMAAG
jgi:hypothetical protein